MKKSDYIRTVKEIKADNAVKDEIWIKIQDITDSQKKIKFSKATKPIIGTVAAAFILAFSVPALADGINEIIKSNKNKVLHTVVPESENLSESIETAVYDDNDGHIKMTVAELLSDEMNVYMTVHYKALDEEGQDWLTNFNFDCNKHFNTKPFSENMSGFVILPYMDLKGIEGHRVNFSFDTQEIDELRTENERWFYLSFSASSREYDSGLGKYSYPMTDGFKLTYLDVTGNVDVHRYKLVSDKALNATYTPNYIEFSELTFSIYGVVNENYDKESLFSEIDEYNNFCSNSYFVMKDGTKIPTGGGASNPTASKETNNYSDYVLLSSPFTYVKDELDQQTQEKFDVKDIVGFETMGVYYKFEATTNE